MKPIWYHLYKLLPGPFWARHSEELAFFLESEKRRWDEASRVERLGFFAHISLDLAGTLLREWRRALTFELNLALLGVGAIFAAEVRAADAYVIARWILVSTTFAAVQWFAKREWGVSKFVLTAWAVGYFGASCLLPGLVVRGHSSVGQTLPSTLIAGAVVLVLISDFTRSRTWGSYQKSRPTTKSQRWAGGVGVLVLSWPQTAAGFWGLHFSHLGIQANLLTLTAFYALGYRLYGIWESQCGNDESTPSTARDP